jgi:hypothetical protein
MIDAEADLPANLDDAGGPAKTQNGDILGRFLEEPIEVVLASGQTVISDEPVFYTTIDSIRAVQLVNGAALDINGDHWVVREIPANDTSGLVRIRLSR